MVCIDQYREKETTMCSLTKKKCNYQNTNGICTEQARHTAKTILKRQDIEILAKTYCPEEFCLKSSTVICDNKHSRSACRECWREALGTW